MSESSDNGLYPINSAKDDAVKWMKYINRRYQNRTKNQRPSRWVKCMLTLRSQMRPVRWLQWQCMHRCSGMAVPPARAANARSYLVAHFSQRSWNALPCSSDRCSCGMPDRRWRPSVFWLMTCFNSPDDTSFCSASWVYVGRSIKYGTLRSRADELQAPVWHHSTSTLLN